MSNQTVRPEQFEKAVMKLIAKYGDDATDMLQKTTTKMARATAKELKGSAPASGEYAGGWTHKKANKGSRSFTDTVYNRKYQLTHLLEKPHSTGPKRGGHYPSMKDYTGTMARAEEKYVAKYIEEVMAKL